MESPDLFIGLWRCLSFEFVFKSAPSRRTASTYCLLRTRNYFLRIAFSDFMKNLLTCEASDISMAWFLFAIQMFATFKAIETRKCLGHFWVRWMSWHFIDVSRKIMCTWTGTGGCERDVRFPGTGFLLLCFECWMLQHQLISSPMIAIDSQFWVAQDELTLRSSILNLPQEFSSDPSEQSFSPLQKSPRSTHWPSPHAKFPSSQRGSSVMSRGFTLRSLFFNLQFFTAPFQSQVCFSMSK